jgi:hypothetical protein
MSEEIIKALDQIEKIVHTGTDEITRALEVIKKRAHAPNIDGKELTLILAYTMQLSFLLKGEQAIGDLITEEQLSLFKGESLREGSKEDIQKGREQIERHKAGLRERIEKDKEKVKKILEDAGLK